jgi:hypothetical protein
MTNTAVHHIVPKSSSLLVIARCRPEAANFVNTQRNQPMCIDLFLYQLGGWTLSAVDVRAKLRRCDSATSREHAYVQAAAPDSDDEVRIVDG